MVVYLIYMQFELKLTSKFAYVGVYCLVSSRPRPNHRRSPAPSRRWHHLGEPLVLILFIKTKSCLCDLDSYLYNFLTRTLFVIHSGMVLISVPVGPRPVMIQMWYILFYNYLLHSVFIKIMPIKLT